MAGAHERVTFFASASWLVSARHRLRRQIIGMVRFGHKPSLRLIAPSMMDRVTTPMVIGKRKWIAEKPGRRGIVSMLPLRSSKFVS